jgi:EAL domain-containing protein (putative c-di-GMP-specific phosphodiesterase class I)
MDGYQFTVLLERIKEPSEPMRVALRIQECLVAPFLTNGVEVFTFASIGIALSSPAFQTPTELLRDADIAMCRAKTTGGSCCEVFDSDMHDLVIRRLKLESELRKSVERNELRVLCQPIVHLTTGRVFGVEALLRWWRNDSELVAPADFIEVAEETGLIVPLGRWILNETCRQAHEWHMHFNTDPLLTATVNVSPRQFAQSNIVADVNPFSKNLVLKIDRSFIAAIEHDCDSREIARLIITLAHHLHLKVIAEGIETLGQRRYLEEFGCEFGQGYLFSEPVGHVVIENILVTEGCDEVKDLVFAGSRLGMPNRGADI